MKCKSICAAAPRWWRREAEWDEAERHRREGVPHRAGAADDDAAGGTGVGGGVEMEMAETAQTGSEQKFSISRCANKILIKISYF